MKNEWDLLLAARDSAHAGEAQLTLAVLSPPRWTIFSGRLARVRGADGTTYELGPDFPAVLHALIRECLDTSLVWQTYPPRYELSFRPGKYHPRFDPARPNDDWLNRAPGRPVSLGSPQALRAFLDALPPEETDPDAGPA